MKIIYSPFYDGNVFLGNDCRDIAMDVQVLETQGLISQLALHAGVHQEIPSHQKRLMAYHKALLECDKEHPENVFHRSIEIDSMGVAKTLLCWRDSLALCGWNKEMKMPNVTRLNTLAEIDANFTSEGMENLLGKLTTQIERMEKGEVKVPQAYLGLEIEIPCEMELMPDYILPMLKSLKELGVRITEKKGETSAQPKAIKEVHFAQQWKAEAWLAQQQEDAYDVWVNTDNKRLDNWLHMAGKPVCGSEMTDANPQITQLFLLAVQLFQRPLNVKTLLRYLFLPKCPLDWKLRTQLAKKIVREGGFCNENVQKCINDYIDKELKDDNDETPQESTREKREENYEKYLPFDLRDDERALPLADESETVDVKCLKKFLGNIKSYAATEAEGLNNVQPHDVGIAQLRNVAEMTESLLEQIDALVEGELHFAQLSQWAQSLYEDGDYALYTAQVGSRCVVNHPANFIGEAEKAIWCDFYGDMEMRLSTDFLSNREMELLKERGVLLWNKQHESDLINLMAAQPIRKTKGELTIVTCEQRGTTKLPAHPLYRQLPFKPKTEEVDLYGEMASKEIEKVDNHREEDETMIKFDAKKHPVSWRQVESFSALEKLLQNPFDYFMNYTLQFPEASETEIKLPLTNGNVAHETIEYLFTAERNGRDLAEFVDSEYEHAFRMALIKKGALLLLPEYHLDLEQLRYKLRECVKKLATLIKENGLTVVECEQNENQDLGFVNGVRLTGYIDMLLRDADGNEVVFDLKYTTKKDKYKKVLEKSRGLQLAIYEAMLKAHDDHPQTVRTAYFQMPAGKLYSSDKFSGEYFEYIDRESVDMNQVKKGYAERVKEINEGKIETADNVPFTDIEYANATDVYPLEQAENTKKNPKKAENKYSDYKSFTI